MLFPRHSSGLRRRRKPLCLRSRRGGKNWRLHSRLVRREYSDLIAVDIDTESGLAFPFFPLQSQFHCTLVERFVFEMDFSQDGLTAFAPVLKGTPATFTERNSKAGFVSLVVAEANKGAVGAGRTVGATPYGAHFLHGERPRFFATESGIYCGFLIPEQCAFVWYFAPPSSK